MAIRVLRVMEYVYPDYETYLNDKKRWTTNLTTDKESFSSVVVAEDVVRDGLNWWNALAPEKDSND